jgi:hypothetical protein
MNKLSRFTLISLFGLPLMMTSAMADQRASSGYDGGNRGASSRDGGNRSAPARSGAPSPNAGAHQTPNAAPQRGDRGSPGRGGRSLAERDGRNDFRTGPRTEPNRPGGMGAGPSFATPAPVQRIAPSRESQPAIQQYRSIDSRTGSSQRFERSDRNGFDRRVDGRRDNDRRDDDRRTRSYDSRAGSPQHFERRDRNDFDFDRRSRDRYPTYRPSAHRPPWRGDIRHFHRYDFHTWQRGRWHREHHGGRLGWWWVVGPSWYFYPAPVYPYPNPYVPPVIVVSPTPENEPQYWYYCADPEGYYPYVEECAEEWQPVPAEPEADMPPDY